MLSRYDEIVPDAPWTMTTDKLLGVAARPEHVKELLDQVVAGARAEAELQVLHELQSKAARTQARIQRVQAALERAVLHWDESVQATWDRISGRHTSITSISIHDMKEVRQQDVLDTLTALLRGAAWMIPPASRAAGCEGEKYRVALCKLIYSLIGYANMPRCKQVGSTWVLTVDE
jgi:hypothetical protein